MTMAWFSRNHSIGTVTSRGAAIVRRRLGSALAALAILLALPAAAWSQTPLYAQRPFDRITLDAANDNEVIDVLPLTVFPDRKLPEKLPGSGKLKIERLDEPGVEYECYWRNIVKIELFEQLILDEVNGLVRAGRFEDAYDYFVQLENTRPDLPGLQGAIDNYLYEEAKARHVKGDYDVALARLREIHRRSPDRPGLDRALGAATDKLVERSISDGQFWIARRYLDNLAQFYSDHPVVTKWRDQLKSRASAHLEAARQKSDGGQYREAQAELRQVVALWPSLPGMEQLRREIASLYPRYVVGVLSPSTAGSSSRLHDWAARRTARLVDRNLLEFVGPGTEGGKYICPVGQMEAGDLGRRLEFRLLDNIVLDKDGTIFTGYDLSRHFLDMANPESPEYLPIWGDLFETVAVKKVFTTVARLGRPFVLPQAMLQTTITSGTTSFGGVSVRPAIGPYLRQETKDAETVFLTNTSYFIRAPSRPKEIVERLFVDGDELIQALRRGDVDIVDRINPWQLDRFRGLPEVEVKRYAVPLVHCLIPNPQRPLSSRRTFRRAVLYGINREAVLRLLLRDANPPGCQVVSGPFSPGVVIDDPLDYAYNKSIEPRGYQPHLAVALAEVALREVAEIRKKKGEPAGDLPQTVLAYPATEMARLACKEIQRQLKLVEIEVELRELGPELPQRIPDDVDFLYAEVAMWEPIVDAERLLGDDGPMGETSPYMRQALRQLRQQVDWPSVGRHLRQIHQLAHAEVTVVPLWQLSDHFAHARDLDGIGDSPVTLYQHVEDWKAASSQ